VKYPGEKYHKDFLGKMRFRKEIDTAKRDTLLRQLLYLGYLGKEIRDNYQELYRSPCPLPFDELLQEAQALFDVERAKIPNWKP
jgi:hypothetical protein